MSIGIVIAAAALVGAAAPQSPGNSGDVASLFKGLQGNWACSGAFANRKPLSADLQFSPIPGGQLLHFRHSDRAPSNYVQDSVWGVDKETGILVSQAWIAIRGQPGTTAAFYKAEQITPTGITFVQQPLLKAPWASNRFRYSLADNALQMVWEVQKQGVWTMGDYLKCSRTT